MEEKKNKSNIQVYYNKRRFTRQITPHKGGGTRA